MKKNTMEYIAPDIECIEINVEGVLCSSTDPGDNEVGNGGPAFDYE